MRHINTQAIILSRTDFGEAARIITFLTPDHGKIRAIAKGVRKQKSKLAGGVELFSVSDISFLVGRGDVYTITSTRLARHYGNIVKNLDRTNAGYDFIKQMDKATAETPEPTYFSLLDQALAALDVADMDLAMVRLWFGAQLLRLAGHTPNLKTDANGDNLEAGKKYDFDFSKMAMTGANGRGHFGSGHIKLLRLVFSNSTPARLAKVQGADGLAADCLPLVQSMLQNHIQL